MLQFDQKLIDDLYEIIIKEKREDKTKGIFQSISTTFYRENYHSDILAYFFSFKEARVALIEWINKSFENKGFTHNIDKENYENSPYPTREDEYRDITIYSSDKKSALIIENKSNDAEDQHNQIPRYYYSLEKNDIRVDAIIYLNKWLCKLPDIKEWKIREIIKITDKDEKLEKKKIANLLVPCQLTGQNDQDFTEKVVIQTRINLKNESKKNLRLEGLTYEIESLFQFIIFGDNFMTDKSTEDALKLLNENEEAMTTLINFFDNTLPVAMAKYFERKFQTVKKEDIMDKYNLTIRIVDKCKLVLDSFIMKTEDKEDIEFAIDFDFHKTHLDMTLVLRRDNKKDLYLEATDKLKKRMGEYWQYKDCISDGSKNYSKTILKTNIYNEETIIRAISHEIDILANYTKNFKE